MPTTVDTEEVVTSVTPDPRRTVTFVIANLGNDDTPITAYSIVVMKDPSYPQRLAEPRTTSQPKSHILKKLKSLYVQMPVLQALK